jgi:hypothetical protein
MPVGVVCARINPDTGLREPETAKGGVQECFYHENVPPEGDAIPPIDAGAGPGPEPGPGAAPRRPEDTKSELY